MLDTGGDAGKIVGMDRLHIIGNGSALDAPVRLSAKYRDKLRISKDPIPRDVPFPSTDKSRGV